MTSVLKDLAENFIWEFQTFMYGTETPYCKLFRLRNLNNKNQRVQKEFLLVYVESLTPFSFRDFHKSE